MRSDSGRQFFGVEIEAEDFKGIVGPFSSREAAERYLATADFGRSMWSGNVIPFYGPIEAIEKSRSNRGWRQDQPPPRSLTELVGGTNQ